MKRYERILICIDDPIRDVAMLKYARGIIWLSEAKDITLLHTTSDPPSPVILPPDTFVQVVDIDKQRQEHKQHVINMRRELRDIEVSSFGDFESTTFNSLVLEGRPLVQTLEQGVERSADLIVVGRHCGESVTSGGDALMARRITRKACCSVLVLPEDVVNETPKRILVPVRDSECSRLALETACAIGESVDAEVVPLNLFQVHAGYSNVGTTYDEHTHLLEQTAKSECDSLLSKTDTGSARVNPLCVPDPHGKPAATIQEVIRKLPAQAVVIGARGRTGAAGVLLGKITEQLITSAPVPVLAVKKKGECLGVLQALLSLSRRS